MIVYVDDNTKAWEILSKALCDALGQTIDETYIKDISLSDNTVTYTLGNDTKKTFSLPNTVNYAEKLKTARSISLAGAVTGSTTFDGSKNQTINTTLSNIDASKITTGTISIDRLPKGALERCIVVENDNARFELTTDDVQQGDTVKVDETGLMYFVKDETKLNSELGYEVYTAGSATTVPWSGVTGKPDTFPPETHSHSEYINQNAFTNIVIDGTTISANNITDTLTLVAGDNIKLIADDDIVTINAINTVYTHPNLTGYRHIPSGGSSGQILRWSADGTAVWDDESDKNTEYSVFIGASSSSEGNIGLVPAPSIGKQNAFLKGDGTWATININIDDAFSTTSNNAVQNKVVTAKINELSNTLGNISDLLDLINRKVI